MFYPGAATIMPLRLILSFVTLTLVYVPIK
jgi:hypothetical protein